MTYDFYADENDIAKILDYIFSKTDLILYELASKYGQEIKFYRETAEVLKNNNFSLGKLANNGKSHKNHEPR